MIKRITQAKSLSSSSAFIIIIILIVVSVAAIVVGGGDGFSRKYAGIDLREFSGQMLLAQTGVVGKILRFEEEDGQYNLSLLPIELDPSLLSGQELYASSVVPPREGDTPFSYRPEEGLRVTQGYPIKRSYVDQHNLTSFQFAEGQGLTFSFGQSQAASQVANAVAFNAESPSVAVAEAVPLPSIPGTEVCNTGSLAGYFDIFYEDVAYDTGLGFDDPEKGAGRRGAVCDALKEFEQILLLDDLGLKPGVVVQASTEGTPDLSLSVVSPQYVGGSGFVSTLLADYLRSGVKRSQTSFSDTVSVLGINSGFMRFNFSDEVEWSVDTGDVGDFDLATVTKQNMLRLLGFGSFLGHEQENILSSSWKRWTEWDRLLLDSEFSSLIDPGTLNFNGLAINYEDFEPGDADEYNEKLLASGGGISAMGANIPDVFTISAAQSSLYEIFTSPTFQKGQSISGLASEDAVSHPILAPGEIKTVSQAEKEILCFLGLAVAGVDGCDEGPRAVAQDVYLERQNNRTVCINIDRGLLSSATDNFILDGEIVETTGTVDMGDSSKFRMYREPCPSGSFATEEAKNAFANQYATTSLDLVRSFSWTPSQTTDLYREYVQFAYAVKDSSAERRTDERLVSIHKCVVLVEGNQLCNGDFQFSAATSPVDYKLSPLQAVTLDGGPVVTCQSTTMPGWCAQGVQDGFSSEFGYTWHPYLIDNPEAFDAELVDTPRRYAGGSSGALVQRLRRPLEPNTQYEVRGQVYVTESGLRPTFWYGSQEAVLPQPDGTYHVDYPEILAAGGEVMTEFILPQALQEGQWYPFVFTFDTGNTPVTHVAFGGSNNNGFVLYDDLSLRGMVGTCGSCLSDLDGNCVTNIDDLAELIDSRTGECPNETVGCSGDITLDGVIDTQDFLQFIAQYGSSCLVEEIPEGPRGDACTDGVDNDGDGRIDQADRDECPLDQAPDRELICDDGIDNDNDGQTDMRDIDCRPLPTPELICDDGIDNDGDGQTDMRDSDCRGVPAGRDPSPSDGGGSTPPPSGGTSEAVDLLCIETGTCTSEALCNDGEDNDGDKATDMRDSDCADGCGYADVGCIDKDRQAIEDSKTSETTQNSSNENTVESNMVVIDKDGLVGGVIVKAVLLPREEIVPNSGGFRANYYVTIQNPTRRAMRDLSVIGVLPSMLTYNGHVATEPNVGYDTGTNTLTIPDINRTDFVAIYFSVDLNNNICAQLFEGVATTSYEQLVQLDLCDQYEELKLQIAEEKIVESGVSLEDARELVRPEPSKPSSSGGGGFPLRTSMCTDGIDNDGDGQIDRLDAACIETDGVSEFGINQCSDGIDNDGDGFTDLRDLQCGLSQGISEVLGDVPECADGIDNDDDGLVDYQDGGCVETEGTSETSEENGGGGQDPAPPQCADGIDNDGDRSVDMRDSDCEDPSDNTEGVSSGGGGDGKDEPQPSNQCSDNIDNDGDGLIDGDDGSCRDIRNTFRLETYRERIAKCIDAEDNDTLDGLIDAADPDCATTNLLYESIIPEIECADGIDNDGDGLIDGDDIGCFQGNLNDEA